MGLVIFFLVAVAEVWVVVAMAKRIGVLAVVVLLILCTLAGLHIVRRYLPDILHRLSRTQEAPEHAHHLKNDAVAAEGGLLMLAAVLFIVPGFLTTIIALLLLIPVVRHFLAKHLPQGAGRLRFGRHVFYDFSGPAPSAPTPPENDSRGVIQVEAKIVEPKDRQHE